MKKVKVLSIILIVVMLFTVGCGERKVKKVGIWKNMDKKISQLLTDEAREVFEKIDNTNLKPIALLGKQVVAGTNYMYLCKTDEEGKPYRVVIVYKNLEGKATITNSNDFDLTKYVNENISYKENKNVGSWYTEINKEGKLEEKVQNIFDEASKKLKGVTYYPISILGKQVVSGTNYAVLAYGVQDTSNENSGVYILTLYEDLKGTNEIVSSAYIDLAEFN